MSLIFPLYLSYRSWLDSLGLPPNTTGLLYTCSVILITLIISYLVFKLAKWGIRRIVAFYSKKSRTRIVEILDSNRFFSYLCYQLPLYIIKENLSVIFPPESSILVFVQRLYEIGVVVLILIVIFSLLNSFVGYYQYKEENRSKPIKGLVQFVQILVVFAGVVTCVSIIFSLSKATVLAGLGALSAILMLVFKDSITGLVAGVQLSFNRMIEIGDWISLPKYDVDGEVIDITITSVKVKNWDKSVSTVPSYNLVINDSVRNWKTMTREGCRKMSRSISLDVLLIRFCTAEMLERYTKIPGVAASLEGIDTTSITNLGVLRAYINYYLQHHPKINSQNGILISQQQANQFGVPLEISYFVNGVSATILEDTQSEIMEHLFVMIPAFDLSVFQSKPDAKRIGSLLDE